MSTSAEGVVQWAHVWRGKAKRVYPTGEIHFVLLTEMGLDVWPNLEFTLRGPEISLSEKTDENGEFRYAPVEFGEYELKVGEAVFRIPAVAEDSPPYRIHVPYDLLPDQIEWKGPTEEELND